MAKGTKTGGREKGTPNRVTRELREVLKTIVYDELNNLPSLLDALEPKERIEVLIRLAPYVLPKVDTINMAAGEGFNEMFSY